jgi:hypothetical protein
MGVAIHAFGACEWIRARKNGDDNGFREGLHYPYIHPDFSRQADKIRQGLYLPARHFRFGMSYGGYNEWRRHLSLMSNKMEPRVIWEMDQSQSWDLPLVPLIYFSDCEGTIGPVTSMRLAEEMRKLYEQAKAYALQMTLDKKDGAGWIHAYDDAIQAFTMAADRGWVGFH